MINKAKDKLYFLNGSVYEQSVSNVILGPTLIFQKSTENFYGLYICKYTNEIYVTNAKNYSQTGEVIRMNSLGDVIDYIATGINPQNLF